jgi:hypothetical protein
MNAPVANIHTGKIEMPSLEEMAGSLDQMMG